MIEIGLNDFVVILKNYELSDIVSTHLSYMKQFSKDDDVLYSVIIVSAPCEAKAIMAKSPDSVNVTGNYYEMFFVYDDIVKTVIIEKKYIGNESEKYLDQSSEFYKE